MKFIERSERTFEIRLITAKINRRIEYNENKRICYPASYIISLYFIIIIIF